MLSHSVSFHKGVARTIRWRLQSEVRIHVFRIDLFILLPVLMVILGTAIVYDKTVGCKRQEMILVPTAFSGVGSAPHLLTIA